MNDDLTLLRDYVATHSEAAFATLVSRYLNLVYSVAMRQVCDAHSAEEITQTVFIILARKADKLSDNVVLSGWLCRTARYACAEVLRNQRRRQQREQEAYMQSALNEPSPENWLEIAPLLDDAMAKLGSKDHDALVLRFFENKQFADVGAALGASEDAAKVRVGRALEKLRKLFAKRGVASTTAVLAGVISSNSVQAAPAGLAQTISIAAMAKGAAASTTITTLVNGTMKTMTWLKIKFAIGVSAAVLLGAGVATVAIPQIQAGGQLTPQQILQQSQKTYAALTSYSDEGKTISTIGTTKAPPYSFSIKLARPNLYRVEWREDYGSFMQTGLVWCAGSGDYLRMVSESRPVRQTDMAGNLGGATGISGGAAASVPGTFFKLNWGNQLGAAMRGAVRRPDEKIGDVDCYVLNQTSNGRAKTLWIGKRDFLIRQVENDTSAATLKAVLDAAAKKYPQTRPAVSGVMGDVKSVETHDNISLNQNLSASDFVP